ncbi:hypothetical protein AX15_007111 [Amanita polypyramis BW_CC]|nr:hypothetical protein AX15_007111 [Amanita polypyramis BW_CC]
MTSQKLCSLWTKPAALDLRHLKEYFEKPLDPDWKVPLSYNKWKEYLASELYPAQACSDEDLELLFKQSEDETAVGILRLFDHAITREPVNPKRLQDGGKSIESFSSNVCKMYGLWDKDDGKERVEHLMAIYAPLVSKGVPNVDRLKKAEIQHNIHRSGAKRH